MTMEIRVADAFADSPVKGELSATVIVSFAPSLGAMHIHAAFRECGNVQMDQAEAIRAAQRLAALFAERVIWNDLLGQTRHVALEGMLDLTPGTVMSPADRTF